MEEQFSVPSEEELFEFFAASPLERAPSDGYWCYEVSDERGVTLRFSFHLFERSVQTALSVNGAHVATISHENADRMVVRERTLRCEFSTHDNKTTLVVSTAPSLQVEWSSLRTR